MARLGGDEFVLVAEAVDRGGAELLKARISAAIADRGYFVDGQQVHVGASVGVALSEEHGEDLPILLEIADLALHHAKSSGRVVAGPLRMRETAPDLAAPRVN